MRVAVVAEWYPSPADPVLGVWAHRQAVAARDAGADVRVLAMRRPIPPLSVARAGLPALREWMRTAPAMLEPKELDGIAIEPVPFVAPPRPLSYGTWGWWMAPALSRALARQSVDVVHAHSILPPGHAVQLTRRRGGVARVVSTHGPDVIHVAEASPWARRATAETLRGADLVLANSSRAERRCRELGGPGIATEVVHLGADLPSPGAARHSRPTLVTVAHLVARKRHADVLRALWLLRDSHPHLTWTVVGDGPERGPLARLAAQLGVLRRIRFQGALPHADAVAAARNGGVFVLPSVDEAFGVAYVEAMAGAVPAIGCRGEPGPEEIAKAGGGMRLVPPADPEALAAELAALLDEPTWRRELGEAARATVESAFTWEACGRATLAAYEEALR
jgi:teichuronic acid biosynthesis glycosyltransferase TuaC